MSKKYADILDVEFVKSYIEGTDYQKSYIVGIDDYLLPEIERILNYPDSDMVTSQDMDVIRTVLSKVRNPFGGYPSIFGAVPGGGEYIPPVYELVYIEEMDRFGMNPWVEVMIEPGSGDSKYPRGNHTWYMGYIAGVGVWIPSFMEINQQLTSEHWRGIHGETKQKAWLYKKFNIFYSVTETPFNPAEFLMDFFLYAAPFGIGRLFREVFEVISQANGYNVPLWELMSFEGTVPPLVVKHNWEKCIDELKFYYENAVALNELTLGDMDMYGKYNIDRGQPEPVVPGDLPFGWWEKMQ